MQTQEVVIRPHVKVTMKSDSKLLDEVMVVAYGGATKRSFTGSATEIKGDKISLKNPTELSKALMVRLLVFKLCLLLANPVLMQVSEFVV